MSGLLKFGRRAALEKAVEEIRQPLYVTAYSWCQDAALADDITHETVLKALERLNKLKNPDAFRPWIYKILLNCFRDHWRSTRPSVEYDENLGRDPGESVEDNRYRAELRRKLNRGLARLPLGQRQVLILVDLQGLSYAETGEVLEIPIGTVMSRLSRARHTMKGHLAGDMVAGETVNGRMKDASPGNVRRFK
ncbi:MAG: RNA polymerase sigma factor [Gammaproteobacteria bacterium]|nr:RNA polymerase sigma factor [Gammaproteobacteria bacterium]